MTKFAWSYSRLTGYETCPSRYYHYNIVKDVSDDTQQSNEGQQAHEAYRLRISAGRALPLPFAHHEKVLAQLEGLPGEHYAEQKLALNREFGPTGFFSGDVWFRTILDFCTISPDHKAAAVCDYKTGKPSTDLTQLELASVTVMHYQPEVQIVNAKLLFMNHNKSEGVKLTREDIPRVWSGILPRVKRLEKAHEENEFPAKPGGLCRRWCAVTSCAFHGRGAGEPRRG